MIQASPADLAPVSLNQANRIRANRNPVSLIRVNQIRLAEASRTQAMPVTVIPTVPATRDHPVGVIPARAIRAEAIAANLIVLRVIRPARKITASLSVDSANGKGKKSLGCSTTIVPSDSFPFLRISSFQSGALMVASVLFHY